MITLFNKVEEILGGSNIVDAITAFEPELSQASVSKVNYFSP